MLPVDSRPFMKRERRVAATDEERNRRFSTMAKRARTEEIEEQNNSQLIITAQHGQKRKDEETEEQQNRGLSGKAQREQERKDEETKEQRNSRLSDMALRSQERRAVENRRTKE
ncbi:hypothetical protein AVEN_73632-1 [Araneus ventricosus]|uniref:STPR domain-containing protein n=1 Tax=Araneus ventricosus TaxID=182803 RepID=A0A4Y2CQ08_ARAVE|nr:hypothetical protein AVEN_2990-1 [Araneus ventricosus]GBM06561.1 hypothetical protein AVEN_73632-1 [Araneus ventricosus]